jgi:hypothetical protein
MNVNTSLIDSSCDLISKYFISEQEKRDEKNKQKMLSDITNNIKNKKNFQQYKEYLLGKDI